MGTIGENLKMKHLQACMLSFFSLFVLQSALFATSPVVDENAFKRYGFDNLTHKSRDVYTQGVVTFGFTLRTGLSPEINILAAKGASLEDILVHTLVAKNADGSWAVTFMPPAYGMYHLEITTKKPGQDWLLPTILSYTVYFGMQGDMFLHGQPAPGSDTTQSVSGNPVYIPDEWKRARMLVPERLSHGKRTIYAKRDVVVTFPADRRLDVFAELSLAVMSPAGWPGKVVTWQGGKMFALTAAPLVQYRDDQAVRFHVKPGKAGVYLLSIAARETGTPLYRRFLDYLIYVSEDGSTVFPVQHGACAGDKNFARADARAAAVPWRSDLGVRELAAALTSGLGSDIEKVRAFYSWLAKNIRYDHANVGNYSIPHNYNALVALQERTGVCNAYARLMVYLCMEANIPCVYESGRWWNTAIQGFQSLHAWNRVFVDGAWRVVDATWGAVQLEKWFCTSPAVFFQSHETDFPALWGVDPASLPYTKR